MKRPRVWNPRPSPAARARILAAVRALLADPDAGGWTAGYAVSPKQLAELPAIRDHLTRSTLNGYLCALVASGHLVRVNMGLYELPAG